MKNSIKHPELSQKLHKLWGFCEDDKCPVRCRINTLKGDKIIDDYIEKAIKKGLESKS